MLQRDIKKTNDKLYDTKEDIGLKFISTKEDYTERFNDFDNIYQDQFEKIAEDIGVVRSMARDSVNQKEKELTALMEKNVAKIRAFVDENIEDMINERRSTLAKYEKQFN